MSEDGDDLEALAAEYVLGTLTLDERREVEARMAEDPAFESLVEAWNRRFAPLAETVPPAEPSPELWQRIETALPAERRVERARPGFWGRVSTWRWYGLGATAVAACLALYIAASQVVAPKDTRFVAVLEAGAAKPAWLVTVDTAARTLTVRPLGGLAADAGAFELWLIRPGAPAPRSLGLLNPTADRAIPISAQLASTELAPATLAVSLEPAGGSPTGLPTGPVLYKGPLQAVEN